MDQTLIYSLFTIVEDVCKSDANVFGYGIWPHHIKLMISIAQRLADEYHADAMAHIQELSSLFYVAYKEIGMDIDEGLAWIGEKIRRDWDKMSEPGREKFKSRYKEIL